MDNDTLLAVATIWQEARGNTLTEQDLVAQVIKNRMRERFFSDGSVVDTVTRPFQFSGWRDPEIVRGSLLFASSNVGQVADLTTSWNLGYPNEPDLVQYYSPGSMTPQGSVPDWAQGKTPALVTPNFRFFTLAQMRG